MVPWFTFWSPQFQFPFSGNVQQRIEPDTNWFFGSIPASAGNGALEQRIHEDVASYGRQIGLLTEVLLALAAPGSVAPEQADQSLERLQEIQLAVEQLKARERGKLAVQAESLLDQLSREDPAAFRLLLLRFAAAARALPAPAG